LFFKTNKNGTKAMKVTIPNLTIPLLKLNRIALIRVKSKYFRNILKAINERSFDLVNLSSKLKIIQEG
jgi:hypothetical protein